MACNVRIQDNSNKHIRAVLHRNKNRNSCQARKIDNVGELCIWCRVVEHFIILVRAAAVLGTITTLIHCVFREEQEEGKSQLGNFVI
jgi:hypothetical protein